MMAAYSQPNTFEQRLATDLAQRAAGVVPSAELWVRIHAEIIGARGHARVHSARWAVIAFVLALLLLLPVALAVGAPAWMAESVLPFVRSLRGRAAIVESPAMVVSPIGVATPAMYALTLGEVEHRVGFRPLAPSALPPGYRLRGSEAVGPDQAVCCFDFAGGPTASASMQLFDGPEGMLLLIQYRLDAGELNWSAPPGTAQPVQVGNQPGWFINGYWRRYGDQVVWETGEQGAWRQLLWSDDQFGYALRGHLPLPDLLQIAAGLG